MQDWGRREFLQPFTVHGTLKKPAGTILCTPIGWRAPYPQGRVRLSFVRKASVEYGEACFQSVFSNQPPNGCGLILRCHVCNLCMVF